MITPPQKRALPAEPDAPKTTELDDQNVGFDSDATRRLARLVLERSAGSDVDLLGIVERARVRIVLDPRTENAARALRRASFDPRRAFPGEPERKRIRVSGALRPQ